MRGFAKIEPGVPVAAGEADRKGARGHRHGVQRAGGAKPAGLSGQHTGYILFELDPYGCRR
jgi:hypothetical protein